MSEIYWSKLLEDSYCSVCLEFIPAGAEVRRLSDGRIQHTNSKFCHDNGVHDLLPKYVIDPDTGLVMTKHDLLEWAYNTFLGYGGRPEEGLDELDLESRARAAAWVAAEERRTADKDWSHVDWSGEYPVVKQGVRPKIWKATAA